jgi:hypothetical protein
MDTTQVDIIKDTEENDHEQYPICSNTTSSQEQDHTQIDSLVNITQRAGPNNHTFTDIYTDGSFKERRYVRVGIFRLTT